MASNRVAATRASAAWAAWGDALGFITELTDASGLRHRAGVDQVLEPIPWRRKVGGRMGVEAHLPAGAYSDDTQLRLATGRAIRGPRDFDVDGFARVELVVWQAYHLGAGRGTKAAAAGMARSEATWNSNMFATKDSKYVEGGGNGAAMRIQPHVWAAPDLVDPRPILHQVMRDAVSTHGSPVALVGAAVHALSLAFTMESGQVPRPDEWPILSDQLHLLPAVFTADHELGGLWVSGWEQSAGRAFIPALMEAIEGATRMLSTTARRLGTYPADLPSAYRQVLDVVGGFDAATRGSGTGTAIAALALAAICEDPVLALQTAANTLGTDTDTIASMAGALIGAVIEDRPPTPPQDHSYIDSEAKRLCEIATGRPSPSSTRYPDLLMWTPPRSSLDLVGTTPSGELALAGLGVLSGDGEPQKAGGSRAPAFYQWMRLPTGQQVYARYRVDPKPLPTALLPRSLAAEGAGRGPDLVPAETPAPVRREPASRQESLFPAHVNDAVVSVDDALAWVRAHGYDAHAVGEALLRVIRRDPGRALELSASFAAGVARDLTRRGPYPPR